MGSEKRQRPSPKMRTAAVLLLLFSALYSPAAVLIQSQALESAQSFASNQLSSISSEFESEIHYRLSLLEAVHVVAIVHGNTSDTEQNFNAIASGLYNGTDSVFRVAIAPNGTYSYVYPITGNEEYLGYDLFEEDDPQIIADVELARSSETMILSRPTEYDNSSLELVARKSVFVNSTWWGFVTISIDFESLVEAYLQEKIDSQYSLIIQDSSGYTFFGESNLQNRDSISYPIGIYNQEWNMVYYPIGGWLANSLLFLLISHIGVLSIVFLTTGISWLTFSKQEELSRLVDKRTISLEEANMGLKREIEERKRVESRLRAQKEELSQFAHMISHDLRGGFHNILGYMELLEDDFKSSFIGKVKEQVTNMQAIVEKSVILADAGLVIDERERTSLMSIFHTIEKVSDFQNTEFEVGTLPDIYCDGQKLMQAIQNLIYNAIIHGNATIIRAYIEEESEFIDLVISNDGVPIPKEIRKKIFQRGFSTKRGHRGLGLTIIEKIIDAHNWLFILDESEQTTFRIRIPKKDVILESNRDEITKIQL